MSTRLGVSLATLLLLGASTMVFAQDEPLTVKQDAPTSYTVVKGDTLWDISAMYLDSPWLWPRLWQVNPEIDNPHLIYPGDKLSLIWRNGQPVLSLKPMVKLSPKVRLLEKQALPTIQEGLMVPYLESDRLLEATELTASARVLGASDSKQYLTDLQHIYVSGVHSEQKWGVYRPLSEYQRGEHKMVALKQVATAELVGAEKTFTGLNVVSQSQEILADDIAIPLAEEKAHTLSTVFYPTPATAQTVASILGALEGSQYVGQNQVVVIDRGHDDKLRQGSMFELYERGQQLDDDTQLPNTAIGNLMVIRPYQFFSLALVTESSQPVSERTLLQSPLDSSTQ
ncbi:hypothetical protein VISI1226_17210 [Vibrio sinaloensis DSM 21326]|uniref:LysM domain-containing protein n=2 Tax=Photobacterium sp. (strain ATCC 43367) TaxID=379097 RepID=E8M4U7_PHOS4|nr:hypothetical protein VISI1226_17210 [Vibrio sinaloensis DSM 21326]